MPRLILYTTSGCHLCEQAQRIVQGALGVPAPAIDIAEDAQLMARYALSIPVLRRVDTEAEIGWPFDERDVLALVEGSS